MAFKDFVKNNLGWILTGTATAGFIATNVLVARETPDVMDKLEKAGEDAGFMDKLKIGAKGYLPAVATGAASLGCMWGAQVFNAGRQAELIREQGMLIAAAGTLAATHRQYREKVREEVGGEREKELFDQARLEAVELRQQLDELKAKNDIQLFALITFPGIVFEGRYGDVCNALMHFNRNLCVSGTAFLAELYTFLGIPEALWKNTDSDKYGWEAYENEVTWGGSYADFPIKELKTADGRKVSLLEMEIPPYRLGLDYGMSDSSAENLYPPVNTDYRGYEDRLLSFTDPRVIHLDPPYICYAHF